MEYARLAEKIREILEISEKFEDLSHELSDTMEKMGILLGRMLNSNTEEIEAPFHTSPLESRKITWINNPDSITYRSAKFLKSLDSCNYVALTKKEIKDIFGTIQNASVALMAMSNYSLINLNYDIESDRYEIEKATDLFSNCPILKMCLGLGQALSWPSPDPEDMEEAKLRFLAAVAKD